jgi:hypothetical protein
MKRESGTARVTIAIPQPRLRPTRTPEGCDAVRPPALALCRQAGRDRIVGSRGRTVQDLLQGSPHRGRHRDRCRPWPRPGASSTRWSPPATACSRTAASRSTVHEPVGRPDGATGDAQSSVASLWRRQRAPRDFTNGRRPFEPEHVSGLKACRGGVGGDLPGLAAPPE